MRERFKIKNNVVWFLQIHISIDVFNIALLVLFHLFFFLSKSKTSTWMGYTKHLYT